MGRSLGSAVPRHPLQFMSAMEERVADSYWGAGLKSVFQKRPALAIQQPASPHAEGSLLPATDFDAFYWSPLAIDWPPASNSPHYRSLGSPCNWDAFFSNSELSRLGGC